jgi:Polyhydroxyalkanoic acid inclusion protein (PhaP_Bmeg)
MAQATKSPEAVKSSVLVKTQVLEKGEEVVANVSESLINTWSEGLDRVCEAKIEAEQKKIIENIRETTKGNLSSVFGPTAGSAFDQYCAQFDVLTKYVQDLAYLPIKEGQNLISQSQEQFKQQVQSGIEQQQKLREDVKIQIKSTQQLYIDFYEKNTKLVLSLFK